MDYTIRRSQRARHVWLRFTGTGELVVVVPRRFDARLVPGVVESNREWIQRAATRAAVRREESAQTDPFALPHRICLPAIGRECSVQYRVTGSPRVAIAERTEGCLVVAGSVGNSEACRNALVRWLHRVAHERLSPCLQQIAADKGFALKRITVRSQRTRWASCSRRGTISLNIRLLFVTPDLVRHIMLHELCHTVRMDHSTKFWTLLEQHDPDWREHRHRLRSEWKSVPAWLTVSAAGMTRQ